MLNSNIELWKKCGHNISTPHSMVEGLALTCNQNSGEDGLMKQHSHHGKEHSSIARIGPDR